MKEFYFLIKKIFIDICDVLIAKRKVLNVLGLLVLEKGFFMKKVWMNILTHHQKNMKKMRNSEINVEQLCTLLELRVSRRCMTKSKTRKMWLNLQNHFISFVQLLKKRQLLGKLEDKITIRCLKKKNLGSDFRWKKDFPPPCNYENKYCFTNHPILLNTKKMINIFSRKIQCSPDATQKLQ